jgi:hypothetical protein
LTPNKSYRKQYRCLKKHVSGWWDKSRPALPDDCGHHGSAAAPIHFYQPVMQLQQKSRQGTRMHQVYDQARIPYQRVLE